jgi:hypothetical protein
MTLVLKTEIKQAAVPKHKGSATTPSPRFYRINGGNRGLTRQMKKSVELFKRTTGAIRVSAEQKSALAYFLLPLKRES